MKRRLLTTLVAAALAVAAGGCTSSEERVQRHLERAQGYVDLWQPEKALIELQSALKLDPQNAEANYRTADLLAQLERLDDALFYYEEAHRLDPSRDDAQLGLASMLLFEDTDRVEKLVEEVLARSPGNPQAHLVRSDVYLVRTDLNAALASALTAAELDPKSARVALQVATVRKAFVAQRARSGQPVEPKLFEEADAAFAHAAELATQAGQPPWLVRSVIERVRIQRIWKGFQPEQARLLQEGFEAVKGSPADMKEIVTFARKHARRAKDADLLHWALSRSVELEPGVHATWVELAELEKARGGDDIAVLKRLVEERPDDPRAHITYADYLARHGKNAEGVAYLEHALASSKAPDNTLAALVSLHLMGGDPDGATKALEKLRAMYPESAQTFFAEANVANREGRIGDAIAALERWTARDETQNGFAMLAEARLMAGNPRDALDAIDRAIALTRKPEPEYQRMRGRILAQLGDNQAALRAFAVARKKSGPLPIAYLPDLARVFYALGRDEDGRTTLLRALAIERPAPGALLLMGRQEAKRDPKAARAALERGAALYPGQPMFIEQLVAWDLREGNKDAALARAQEAAARLPDLPRIQMMLARTLLVSGRTDEAVAHTESLQQRWSDQPGVGELYLDVMTRVGRGDEAFQALAKQHAEGKLAPTARVMLARLYNARGESDKAADLLRSALQDQPDLPAAQNDLAYTLATRGEDLEKATELAQEARANRPDSPDIADTLGYVYLRRELGEAALVQFDAALELAEPESSGWATAQFHRGLALRQLGRQPEAVAALEQALATGADFGGSAEAHRVLAELANGGAAPPEG